VASRFDRGLAGDVARTELVPAPERALMFSLRRASQMIQKATLGRQKTKWRDPESNRGHHDFQGRASGPENTRKVLQIAGWLVGSCAPGYPWLPLVAGGLRTWRAAEVLFASFT
jgi:hypothetical protein